MFSNVRVLSCAVLISACFNGAWANARLPVVNVAKDGVSARAAFGEPLPKQIVYDVKPVAKSSQNNVAAKKAPVPQDILVPNRPSENLWAKSENRAVVERAAVPIAKIPDYNSIEKTIRMPESFEFARVEEDFALPEENLFADHTLDYKPRESGNDFFAGVRPSGAIKSSPQIASNRAALKPIEAMPMRKAITMQEQMPIAKNRISTIENKQVVAKRDIAPARNDEDVVTRRVVVPMDDMPDDTFARNLITNNESRITDNDDDDVPLTKLSPMQLKRAFQKTYISENKHLSAYKIDDRFDVASDMVYEVQGFDSARDLSERGGVRPLEIRLGFRGNDSALSRDNFSLLSEYAGIVASNPKRAIQISIPERSTRSFEGKRVAARRLAIIEQVLQDSGVTDQRIIPVLSQRSEDSFVLRIISLDMFQTLSEKQRDMFGDTVSTKNQKSLSW